MEHTTNEATPQCAKVVCCDQPALLCGVGHFPVRSNICHLDESRSVADTAQHALIVAFEDESNGSEDI